MTYCFTSTFLDEPINTERVIDIFEPHKCDEEDVAIFFIHGGGWRAGSRSRFYTIMKAYSERGFRCASVDYRLGNSNIFDQIADIRHGYDFFISHLKKLGKPLKVLVFGSSAGAHLAALLSLAAPGDCGDLLTVNGYEYENDWVQPLGVALQATPVTFVPWDEIFPGIWASMEDIVGTPYSEAPELYKKVSPANHVKKGSPAVFFLEAENEHMFPRHLTMKMVDLLIGKGVKSRCKVYRNTEHGFFYDITRKRQEEAFIDIIDFIRMIQK
jgi:acetyl esterase/lipase